MWTEFVLQFPRVSLIGFATSWSGCYLSSRGSDYSEQIPLTDFENAGYPFNTGFQLQKGIAVWQFCARPSPKNIVLELELSIWTLKVELYELIDFFDRVVSHEFSCHREPTRTDWIISLCLHGRFFKTILL
jgi:hypothetical protein